jgi:hypothetical protein
MIDDLKITISPTADGGATYVQIISGDQLSVNVVLIAKQVDLADVRPRFRPPKTKGENPPC